MTIAHYLLLIIASGIIGDVSADQSPLTTRAKNEYRRCLHETSLARKECVGNGCGNILVSCYERQIGVIEADSEKLTEELQSKPCAKEAIKLNANFKTLQEANSSLGDFGNSWSGFDLRVKTAFLKNQALHLLALACGA